MTEKNKDDGSDSGSDSGGSVGTDSGSAGNGDVSGSGGNDSLKRGNDSGSGGNDSGSGASGSGSADGNGNDSADDILDIEPSNGNASGNSDTFRPSRNQRERVRGSIRLGSATRNSATDGSGTGTGTGDEKEFANDPVIRLGAKKQGRPRAEVTEDNTTELKLSEMKDLISMFLDSIFEIPAVTLGQSFWRLQKEENKALTDAVLAYIKSMPKNKSNWLMTFIKENLPLVNLLMVGFFIVSGRVQNSIAVYQVTKHGKNFEKTIEQPKPSNNGAIRTPLDARFS